MQLSDITNIKPLDLMVFKGDSYISRIIREFEKWELSMDDVSHVGVVVTRDILPHIPQLKVGRKYILESTVILSHDDKVNNVITGSPRFGVQIRDLEYVILNYDPSPNQKIGYARLINNNFELPYIVKVMKDVMDKYANTLYEINPIKLLACVSPTMRWLRDIIDGLYIEGHYILSTIRLINKSAIDSMDIKSALREVEKYFLFCSELAVIIYQALGIISNDINPAEVAPVQVARLTNNGKPIFSEIKYITYDDIAMIPIDLCNINTG